MHHLFIPLYIKKKKYSLTFSTFCITFMTRKKHCHLKKLFCEGNYRLELSFSWLRNIMRISSASLNKSTKRWTCSFCVEYQEESGSLWIQANQTETSPPTCLPSCLIPFPRAGNSITASWFWVPDQIKCVPVEMKTLITISLQPLAI